MGKGSKRMTGMLAQVQVGQKAVVSDLEHGFELVLVEGAQPGLTIIEVHADHILLEDAAASVVTRVPTYLIKAVRSGMAPPQPLPSAAA
jgi:hypothetical protein